MNSDRRVGTEGYRWVVSEIDYRKTSCKKMYGIYILVVELSVGERLWAFGVCLY